jgi:hypothetical protein
LKSLPIAQNFKGNRLTGYMLQQQADQGMALVNGLAVDGRNYIARLQPGLGRGGVADHLLQQRPLGNAELLLIG